MSLYKGYEMIIGLEVHVELKTKSKIFCNCKTDFGAEPNTQICPVCMGMPGTLPVLNGKAVEYAVKAGAVTNCSIANVSEFDRKNYFYPDLPKGYQITQFDTPICSNGYLDIDCSDYIKRVGITRIHLEEDAGKLIHDNGNKTLIDCNRCGIPLIEIVSEPDIRSAEEACAYLKKLRTVMIYAGVSDCKMNEGSMRCDVNLSVRKAGENQFGIRTEMKNLNSFLFIAKAIEYEYKRQVDMIEKGLEIFQETRRFDETSGKTYSMRKKENSNDYRYFPEPDLPALVLSDDYICSIKADIPVLPDERKNLYMKKYGLTAYDSDLITSELFIADYFESIADSTDFPKIAANLLITDVLKLADGEYSSMPVKPERLAVISDMLGNQRINSPTAKKIIKELAISDFDVEMYILENNLEQINDRTIISDILTEVLRSNEKSVADYKNGKTAALKSIVGQAMAKTCGRGNPVIINEVAIKLLNK